MDAVLATILALFYVQYGRSVTDRAATGRTFILVSMTSVLIMSIVQASVVLSLGLVGALSVARFRTPIKDPEELAFLFMAIAIGLGLGARQDAATLVGFFVILGVLSARKLWFENLKTHSLFLTVEAPESMKGESTFGIISDVLSKHTRVADLRRLDLRDETMHMSYYVECPDDNALEAIKDNLKAQLPGATIHFVAQDQPVAV